MTRVQQLKRIEFINFLQRYYRGLSIRQELQAEPLIAVMFQEPYDLQNPQDIGLLLDNLETKIDEELKPELMDYLSDSMGSLTMLGVKHAVEDSLSVITNRAYEFMDLSDRLALDYITRVGVDGRQLSDRIWSQDAKDAIMKEVYKGVREGNSIMDVATNIQSVVKEGTPMYKTKRIAETELSYAYSHAKADIAIAEAKEFPNMQAYIEVSLSPAHNVTDICDSLHGVYKAEEAPLPPFHPNCLCITETKLLPRGKKVKTTTIESQTKQEPDLITVDSVETASRTVTLKD